MPARFNRYLRGWLGLLDAKVGGFTPTETSDLLQPQLDTFPFLYAQTRELVSGNTGAISAAAEGFNPCPTLEVPSGEIWFVEYGCALIPLGVIAASHAAFAPAVQIRSTALGLPRELVLGDFTPEFTSSFAYFPHSKMGRYVGLPGDLFGIWCSLLDGAGTFDIQLNLLMARVPI
jgi:hypothetical protein